MDLASSIQKQVEAVAGSTLANKHGLDQETTSTAIGQAVTAILGGLQHNAATPEGARKIDATLARHHTGQTETPPLINGALQAEGAKILSHVFGSQAPKVTDGLSHSAGVSQAVSTDILTTIGPLVLGQLGKTKQANGLDADSLADVLINQQLPKDGLAGTVLGMLDRNKDGSVIDDVIDIGRDLFGKK